MKTDPNDYLLTSSHRPVRRPVNHPVNDRDYDHDYDYRL